LCAVSEGGVLRSREGFGSRPTQNFSFSSASMDPMIALSSSGSSGRISAGIVPANAPDTKGLILGFFSPPGRDRGEVLVYTLLPPLPAPRTTRQKVSLESGRPAACPAPVDTIRTSRIKNTDSYVWLGEPSRVISMLMRKTTTRTYFSRRETIVVQEIFFIPVYIILENLGLVSPTVVGTLLFVAALERKLCFLL
jgi:hypothetical protein